MQFNYINNYCDEQLPDVPESVDGRLGVPELDLLGPVQHEQRLHGLLRHVGHRLLVHERHQAVDQLQRRTLDLVTRLARVLQQSVTVITAFSRVTLLLSVKSQQSRQSTVTIYYFVRSYM